MSNLLIILNLIFLVAVVFFIWKRTVELKSLFLPALVFKVAMGLLLGIIYSYYYTVGDTLAYVKDGNVMAELASNDFPAYIKLLFQHGRGDALAGKLTFGEPRAIFLSKAVSIFSIITGGNYWVISVYFSLLSFFGCWYLVKIIHRHIPSVTFPATVAFLFFPSVVFWTSGVIKESLAIGSLSLIGAVALKIWFSSPIRWYAWIGAVFASWLAWNLKYYFAAIFFSVVITTVIYRFVWKNREENSFVIQCATWLVIFSVLLSTSSFLHPNFSPNRFFKVIVENYQAYQNLSAPGDALQFNDMSNPDASVLWNAPVALFSGLYRPFIWEATGNFFQLWIGVENVIVALLSIVVLVSFKQKLPSQHRILVVAIVVYVVILCVLLTLSTPNFGTLSRYRTSYFPFFVMLLLATPKINAFLQRTFNRLVPSKA